MFKTLTRLDNGRTFYRALALGLSSELPTLCGQLARRSTAKLCHNQVHMTCGSHPLFCFVSLPNFINPIFLIHLID